MSTVTTQALAGLIASGPETARIRDLHLLASLREDFPTSSVFLSMGQVESANSYSLNYLHIKVFISCIYKKLVSVSCENILQKCIGLACQEGLKEFTLTALFFCCC